MTPTLNDLITGAIRLAGGEATANSGGLWHMEGGRPCPLGWDDCSQPVFVDLASGEYDYGDPGGPGHDDCRAHCKNGMQPRPPDEDEEADAHLIAAAPDSLSALRDLEAMAERYRQPGAPIPDAQKKARAAIAKAVGRAA